MDDPTILITIAGIVATGSLSKVGVNITDSVICKTNQLLFYIQDKLPQIATSLKNIEQPIDYSHIYSELKLVANNDREMQKLLQETKEAVQNDPKVAQAAKQELNNARPQISTIVENWNGINIKGRNNSISGNTFNF